MSDTQLTATQIEARRNLGRWLFYPGIIILLFGLYISAFLIPDVIQASSGPESLTLEEAAQSADGDRTYARLEDGSWDCATLKQVQGFSPSHRQYDVLREETKTTEIFFANDSREIVAFITLSGAVDCDDLTGEVPSGYLYAMSDDTRRELTNDARLVRYSTTADTFLEFCGYCGRDNSLIGAVFGVVFTLLGIAMVVFGRKMKNTYTD